MDNTTKHEVTIENTRSRVLTQAKEVINGPREQEYGNPSDNFKHIADYWTLHLRRSGKLSEGQYVDSVDVACMMQLLKLARATTSFRMDTFVDIAGYAALAFELGLGDGPTKS